ncbi:MAG TPA: nuclear transport factor 2 family protein [Pyrinomonadaceae bacterium]|jgi:ketosteroid isomerase-like protein|nr:nuclear transport factor 2 family protein [Pyrinomonadaceae bacterium]
MLKVFALILLTCGVVAAQNSNSSTTTERQRKTNTNRAEAPAPPKKAPAPASTAQEPGSEGVLAAFNTLLDGIRHASVDEVMSAYWNNPRLNLFNYNGTVTKGWEQVRKNRESSYPEIKDVKLEVRDVSVTMLGQTGAVVTCQWKQSQTYKGAPETVSGRMTLVFKRIGNAWKAIHLHSSTDTPNPAVIPPSEQPVASPTPA